MGKVKSQEIDKVGAGRMVRWQSREISKTAVVLISGYLTIYCTDTLQMPAALVGVLLVASKVLDGITDVIAGYIVDKTQTRWGKGRPYEVFIVGLWLCTWLMFSCPPEFSLVAKSAWVFVMYAFVNAVCLTFLNASNTVYMVRAFNKQKQYIAISSYGGILSMLSGVMVNVSFPMLMGTIATSAAGWSRLIALYAVPLGIFGLLRMFTVKEKYESDVKAAGEKMKFNDSITVFKTNHYIYIIAIMSLVFNVVANMGVNVYYFTYIVKDVGVMGVLAITTLVILPISLLFPTFLKKISIARLIIIGFLIMAAGFFLNFIAGANIPLLMVANLFTGAGQVPVSMLLPLMIIDCAEFNEWKGIRRMEGTMSSLIGLAQKIGAAVGAGLLGVLLSASGYTGAAETMPNSAITMIRMLFSLIPMVLYLLVAVTMRFYKLDKNIKQIREENQVNREKLQNPEV